MPAIFTRPYKKYYHAPIFSGATALLLTAAVVLLILPFVLAYLSHCKVIDREGRSGFMMSEVEPHQNSNYLLSLPPPCPA